tara:strand:- start:2493 stop:3599 length:1107 start_codon:yes stop_codon:yes gene_type:complete
MTLNISRLSKAEQNRIMESRRKARERYRRKMRGTIRGYTFRSYVTKKDKDTYVKYEGAGPEGKRAILRENPQFQEVVKTMQSRERGTTRGTTRRKPPPSTKEYNRQQNIRNSTGKDANIRVAALQKTLSPDHARAHEYREKKKEKARRKYARYIFRKFGDEVRPTLRRGFKSLYDSLKRKQRSKPNIRLRIPKYKPLLDAFRKYDGKQFDNRGNSGTISLSPPLPRKRKPKTLKNFVSFIEPPLSSLINSPPNSARKGPQGPTLRGSPESPQTPNSLLSSPSPKTPLYTPSPVKSGPQHDNLDGLRSSLDRLRMSNNPRIDPPLSEEINNNLSNLSNLPNNNNNSFFLRPLKPVPLGQQNLTRMRGMR